MKLTKTLTLTTLLALAPLAAQAQTDPPKLIHEVELKDHDILGNAFSQTLYVFDADKTAGKPICTGVCAEKWPPYILTADEVAQLQAPLGAVARENGLQQLLYNGRPVYTFHQDRALGDIKGDGLGGLWHTVTLY